MAEQHPPSPPEPGTFTRFSCEVVAAEETPVDTCDVCGEPVSEDDEGAETPWSVSGHGLYLWARGGKIVYEEPPLCASCGTAIGMSALARWEIEEEEG